MGLTRNGIRSFMVRRWAVAAPNTDPLSGDALRVPHRLLLCLLGRRDEFGVLQHLLQERGRIARRGLLHVSSFVSGDSGVHPPLSQIITVPPPYSPSGMIPSNFAYSSGWSSTAMARRLTEGSREGPFGTAHDSSTPFHSRRKS